MMLPIEVPEVRPVRCALRRAVLAAVTVLSAGALAAPAWAQGRIQFDAMAVEICREFGDCEWQLSCKVGGKETALIASAKGKHDDVVAIGKAVDVARFPVKVDCTAQEDDGFFGESWQPAGTGSATLAAGGATEIQVQSEDQGRVVVRITADSIEGPGAAPEAGARRYVAVFRAAPEGHAVVAGLEWPAFQKKWREYSEKGLRLDDFETYVEGKKRLWTGIFRAGGEEHAFEAGLEWEPFVAKFGELTGGPLRLVDLESYGEGKKRLFAGAFRESTESHNLWVGLPHKEFLNKMNELQGQGQRLIDLEVYLAGRQKVYSGAFRAGTGSSSLWLDMEWPAFQAKFQEKTAEGQRLTDVETYEEGKKRLYSGSFRGGTGQHSLEVDLTWPALVQKWKGLASKGLRLVDLETYPE